MQLIDISGWEVDRANSPYPEGSRDKYAVLAPEIDCPKGIIPRHRYLMKFSNSRYPVQFWSEAIAAVLGPHFGVAVPPCYLATDPQRGEPGSLIEWFYGATIEPGTNGLSHAIEGDLIEELAPLPEAPKTHSLYVPGSSYMARKIPDYDLKTGAQHNLRDVGVIVNALGKSCHTSFWPHWGGMLTFDALIGNTDRHQDNWGVLWRSNTEGKLIPRFAPAFDNGTSLLHEIMEDRLDRLAGDEGLDRYVRRGYHHMRWQLDDERQAAHVDLIRRLWDWRPDARAAIQRAICYDSDAAHRDLRAMTETDISVPLSARRIETIIRVMGRRRELLCQELEIQCDP